MKKTMKIFGKVKDYYTSMGFKYKLMLFCIGIVVIPAILITAMYTNQLSNTLEEQNIKNATYELTQSRDNLRSSIRLVEELSNQIYFNNTLSKELLRQYDNKGESVVVYVDIIKPLIDPLQSLHRNLISDITIYIHNDTFLPDSESIIYIDDELKRTNWYKQSMKNSIQSDILWLYDNSQEGQPKYSLYRNLNNYLGNSAGVLKIDVYANALDSMGKSEGQHFWIMLEDSRDESSLTVGKEREYPDYLSGVMTSENGSYDIEENGYHYRVIHSSFTGGYSTFKWKAISSIPVDSLMHDVNVAKYTALLLGFAAAVLLLAIIILYANGITKRINHLATQTGRVMDGNFDIKVDVEGRDEIGQLGESFNEMLNYLDNLVNEVYENKIKIQNFQLLQRESELRALQNKINPHFLYNTLDAIRFRAIIANNEELAEMMVSLSRLLSYSINNKSDIVNLGKEIEHVGSYINLMKVRYEDRLNFTIDIDTDLYTCLVNKLILQPIVENAIYHGIRPLNTAGHISITAQKEGEYLIIKVVDDGKGMTKARLEEVNRFEIKNNRTDKVEIGLGNVNDRIKLFFGDQYGLKAISELGSGTTIVITLPFKLEGEYDV